METGIFTPQFLQFVATAGATAIIFFLIIFLVVVFIPRLLLQQKEMHELHMKQIETLNALALEKLEVCRKDGLLEMANQRTELLRFILDSKQ